MGGSGIKRFDILARVMEATRPAARTKHNRQVAQITLDTWRLGEELDCSPLLYLIERMLRRRVLAADSEGGALQRNPAVLIRGSQAAPPKQGHWRPECACSASGGSFCWDDRYPGAAPDIILSSIFMLPFHDLAVGNQYLLE